MKNHLMQLCGLTLIFASLVGCNRVPVGVFGVSGSGGANAISVDAGANTAEERKLTRLKQIDQKIQESADRLSAILDPTKTLEPANLDKLVVGDAIDPSLSYDRRFSANQKIEQKLDQKALDLISGVPKETAVSPDTSSPDSSLLNDRTLRNQAEIDQSLNTRASGESGETTAADSKQSPEAETSTEASKDSSLETQPATPSEPEKSSPSL
ncbi:MAG: hypothetical protein AB7I41_01440 [Candidatus Sericytochromatia bacterium]